MIVRYSSEDKPFITFEDLRMHTYFVTEQDFHQKGFVTDRYIYRKSYDSLGYAIALSLNGVEVNLKKDTLVVPIEITEIEWREKK